MTTIATARIAHRLDDSPTERFNRIPAQLPATVTSALAWSTVDIKPADHPTWCAGEYRDPDDGTVAHFGAPRVVVAEVGTQSPQEITASLTRIVGPGRTPYTVIDLDDVAMSPEQALQLGGILVELARTAMGTTATADTRTAYWTGYRHGMTDAIESAEAATVQPSGLRRLVATIRRAGAR